MNIEELSSKPNSESLMPAPFEWIKIPGGKGKMITNETAVKLDIPTAHYWIAKYPVTNAQFSEFIQAGGYKQKKWWTKQGWEEKKSKSWEEPRYWQYSDFNGADHPVAGVSWYEAVAFCLWLSEATDENIMLPTEEQWQYAAQGKDRRRYPWGNDWDASRCNSIEQGIGKTTPVTQYEGKGDSPFGVVDMAGNVYDWCVTDYDHRRNDINRNALTRVIRGGYWFNFNTSVRTVYRYFNDPSAHSYGVGFRLCRRSFLMAFSD